MAAEKKQGELDGMRPKKIKKLEELSIAWRECVAVHKKATTAVTEAKAEVRKYMAKNNVPEYFLEGYGGIEWEPEIELERDIVWKPIKRKPVPKKEDQKKESA